MPRRTRKYLAALQLAEQLQLPAADDRPAVELYEALTRHNQVWDSRAGEFKSSPYIWPHDAIPDHLATLAMLAAQGLQPARMQMAVAQAWSTKNHRHKVDLYAITQAVPTRKALKAQLRAFEQQLQIRRIASEVTPDDVPVPTRQAAIKWAQQLLSTPFLLLDVETTGLNTEAEIIEIALLDRQGNTLLQHLVKPLQALTPNVTHINHITPEMLRSAPHWPGVQKDIQLYLQDYQHLVSYNSPFLCRLLQQSAAQHGCEPLPLDNWTWHCVMQQYAAFHGVNSVETDMPRWQSLVDATCQLDIEMPGDLRPHRAVADALATLKVLEAMANQV